MTPSQQSVYQKLVDDLLVRAARLHYDGQREITLDRAEFEAAFMMAKINGPSIPSGTTESTYYFAGLKVNRSKKRTQ